MRMLKLELGPSALLSLMLAAGCSKTPSAAKGPTKVGIVTVQPRDVPIFQQWIGTLDGYPNAQIRAQVSGYLMKQNYREGSVVKQGDLLFEIDPRPFQAALDQAIAKQQQDEAMLAKTGPWPRPRPLARNRWTMPSRPIAWPKPPSKPIRRPSKLPGSTSILPGSSRP
jgi:multidrug efflux pump subunit AcrA (membrane-fusion protein)